LSVLDQPDRLAALDPKSMRTLIGSWPSLVGDAARLAPSLSLTRARDIAQVVVSGMGGSAIAGDVVRAVAAPSLKVPLLVSRDYALPAFAGPSTLVIASSYSGNTEETLSSYQQARAAGASIVCLASGGKLAAAAHEHGYPVIPLPGGLPPRSVLGYSAVMLFGVLTSLGLLPDMGAQFTEAVEVLNRLTARYGPSEPEIHNPAKGIARSLHGKIAAVYASSALLDPAAVRWRGQIEENAKSLAFHHLLPEMDHNELVGWEIPEAALRQIGVIFLRDRGDHHQVQRRFDLTRQIVAQRAGVVQEVWTEGESSIARIFSLVCLGDFVSFYLACLNEVDPTPVSVIETLKQRLVS
jgi:glucose/mannose-6-phosphate isomerase